MAAWLSSDRLYLGHSVSVCVCLCRAADGDRQEVERHLRSDYSVPVTGGRRVRLARCLSFRLLTALV